MIMREEEEGVEDLSHTGSHGVNRRHPQRRSCEHMAVQDILVPAIRVHILAVCAYWPGWFPW